MKVRIKPISEERKNKMFGWWYYQREDEEFELIKTEGPPEKSEVYFLVEDHEEDKQEFRKKHVKYEDAELVERS